MIKWVALVITFVGVLTYFGSKPENIRDVIIETCEYTPEENITSVSRDWDRYSFSIQGLFYTDSGTVQLSKKDAINISASLTGNKSYELKNKSGYIFWEKHVVGKKLVSCHINKEKNTLEYSYFLW